MARITRTGAAHWQGGGKDGRGALSTQSGTLADTPYSFSARFAEGKGTNPEELIAAAHAGCFSMALAFQIAAAGHRPESLRTEARLSIAEQGTGWAITDIVLTLRAKVPGIDAGLFRKLAEEAKATCPVSKVLNAPITLDAALE